MNMKFRAISAMDESPEDGMSKKYDSFDRYSKVMNRMKASEMHPKREIR